MIIGTYIGACYPSSLAQTYWLTSPVINCSNLNACILDFWSFSGSESNSFDHLYVDVYNGSAWTNIYANSTSGSEAAWTQRTYPVTQANNNANFQVRFGIGTTDGSVTYSGWNIDDLTVKCNGTLTTQDTLCDFSTTQDVIVAAQPTSDFTVVTPICINSTTTITYTGTAAAGSTYTWDFSGGTIVSGSGAGPYVVQWSSAADYNISLIVDNNGCASTQTNNTVSVLSFGDPFCCVMPTPNAGADDNVCGLTYTLNATPSLPNGTWSCVQGGVTINNPNNPVSVVTVPANGTYDFVWYEIYGTDCDSTDTVSITFTQQPVADAGTGFDICSHTNTLNAVPSVGTGTWTCNNPLVTFTPATSPTATVTVPSDGQFIFTWTEDNTNGCVSSDVITTNFAAQPTANAGTDNAVCLLSYTLQATPSVGTGTWTFSGPGSATFQNNHSAVTQVSVSLTGTYTFTWTEDNGLGCTSTDDVVIQLTQIPTSTFTTTEILCSGQSSTITYTGTGNSQCTYTWDFDGGAAVPGTGIGPHSVTWVDANTYDISLQVSLNGCQSTVTTHSVVMPELLTATIQGIDLPCYGIPTGQVLLTVDGGTPSASGSGYYYLWNNGYLSEDLTNMTQGYYSVTVTDANGCSLTRSVTIVQPPQLSLVVTPSQIICPGTSPMLTIYPVGGTYPYEYYWNGAQAGVTLTVTPSATTTYTAYVTDAHGCQSQTVSTTVSIHPPLQLTASVNMDSICPSESVLIAYSVSAGSGAPYTVTGSDGVYISNPYTYFPAATESYIVTARDDCGQVATAEIPLHVYQLPPNAFLADTVRGCQPFRVNFIEISPDMGQTYIWDFGDNTNLSLDKTPEHIFTTPGTFDVTLTVTSVENCKTVNVVEDFITVYPRPNALFTYYPSVVSILKPVVSFTNMSDWGYSYIWSFGTGDSSSEVHPAYHFPDVGIYPVSLITISEYGCLDTSQVNIMVNDEVTFYAPSAFSPDNDMTNDVFYVTGHGIDPTQFKMVLYDRWGQELFSTNKYDPYNPEIYGWNGKDKSGKTVKSGTYTWIVVFNDFKGSRHEFAGNVTVIW
jgi:gliding motility-associated-like protein